MQKVECKQDVATCGHVSICGLKCPHINCLPDLADIHELRPQDVVWLKQRRATGIVTEIVLILANNEDTISVAYFGDEAPASVTKSKILFCCKVHSPFLEGADYE